MNSTIVRGQSCAADPRRAAAELHAAIAQPDRALAMFFCSSRYDLERLGAALAELFDDMPLVGCTTAGEIGPAGYRDGSICGVSFGRAEFSAVYSRIEGLRDFEISRGRRIAEDLLARLHATDSRATAATTFALLLIDGLSRCEESVAHALQAALGGIPLLGGSAGDSLDFDCTRVFGDGRFATDAADLVLVHTPLPFTIFKMQHLAPDDRRGVITGADAPRRVVTEIDGWPAIEGYARLVGRDPHALDARDFALAPLVVMVGDTSYVRSIQRANPDGSLSFFCAIDEGMVVRPARGGDLVADLDAAFALVASQIGEPLLSLCFDCILRKLEVVDRGLESRVRDILARQRALGFNTYGEQFRGMHVNQTLTGVAIGQPRETLRHA